MDKNRIIARFMGFESSPFKNEGGKGFDVKLNGIPKDNCNGSYSVACYGDLESNIEQILGQELKYHKCWNWLMPVVDKIESTFQIGTGNLCKVYISSNNEPKDPFFYCNIYGSEDNQFNGESKNKKIDSVYDAVVDFINWYDKYK